MSSRTCVVSIALLLTLHSYPSHGQETTVSKAKSALGTLPEDTTLLLRVRNCGDFAKKWKASPFYSLRENPSFKAFFDRIKKEFDEGVSEARAELGFDPLDFIQKVEGEAVFAVGSIDKIVKAIAAGINSGGGENVELDPSEVPILLQFDAGPSTAAMKEYIEKLIQLAQKDGASKSDVAFQGGTITTLTKKEAPEAKEETFYMGEHGTLFFFSVNRGFLEKNMAAVSGSDGASLGSNADFATTNRTVGEDSDILFYLNLGAIINSVRAEIQSQPMFAMFWGLIEGQILGRQLKNVGWTSSMKADGVHNQLFVNDGGAKQGILGVIDGPGFSSQNPGVIIPEDADQFSKTMINIPHLYSIVKQLLNMGLAVSGNAGMDVEQFVELQFQIKLKDIVESLGSEVVFFTRSREGNEASEVAELFGGQSVTLALTLRDDAPIRNLMAKLGELSGGAFQAQKYLEHDIYRLDPAAGESGPAIGLLDKMIVFGIEEGQVKEVMRRDGKAVPSIKDNPEFKGLLGTTPEKVVALEYYGKDSFKQSVSALGLLTGDLNGDFPVPDMEPLLALISGAIAYSEWRDEGFYMGGVLRYANTK